jgi:DNA-binding NtrC family response regulator
MSKILIVDHDPSFLERTTARLVEEGHQVDQCTEASQVPHMVATGSYAMLLLEVGMPNLNAEDLLALLRNLKSTSQTRVIVWSAAGDPGVPDLAKKYEAEFIQKDADPKSFAGLVRQSFASKPPGIPT